MKRITKLEDYKNRIKVFLDDESQFLLYKGEVRKFQLEEDKEIDDDTYKEIYDLLFKRARERALYILDDAYKTEKQIVDKLAAGFYPEAIIERVITFLKKYDMINDLRYAKLYIEYKCSSKSKKEISQNLYIKGISRDIIDLAFEECEYTDEESLNKIIAKRIGRYDLNNKSDIQKLYRYLVGKGFSFTDIKTVMDRYIFSDS